MNPNLLMLRDRIASIVDTFACGRIAEGLQMLRRMLADIDAVLKEEHGK